MTTTAAREISRVLTHESEALTAGHIPSDPQFSIRILGDHLHVSTAAHLSVSADQLHRISEILSAPANA